jgi:hypothetical protein
MGWMPCTSYISANLVIHQHKILIILLSIFPKQRFFKKLAMYVLSIG